MEYRFLDIDDDELIAASELPIEGGIAVVARTTGYDLERDEVCELSIVDLGGDVLFSQRVKPQNVEAWDASGAAGGIAPRDVAEAPELYQFEDEVRALFEGASVVVALHPAFARSAIEASWVSLPNIEEFDLVKRFCESHSSEAYPGLPAATASLAGIAEYYGVNVGDGGTRDEARAIAACYRALVAEHDEQRAAKGEEHWEAYRQRKDEEARNDVKLQAARRNQEIRTRRVNAILWLCAAAIFSNLAVQMNLRGMDFGLVAVAAAAAVFFAVRWVMCLVAMYRLRHPHPRPASPSER